MKQALVLTTLVALIAAVSCGEWIEGLRIHFDPNLFGYGKTGFYDIPKTVSKAVDEGWKLETRPDDGHHPSLVMYCHSPPAVCGLYDDTGNVAGLNIALSQEIFTNNPYDMVVSGFTEWTASDNKKYWTIQEFFVSEEYLAIDKETRLASRNNKKMLQLDSVWVVGMNKELYKIPNNTAAIKTSDFTQQACIPLMGLHYYYKMDANLECSAETILPWFPMYDDGKLVGVGFMTFGVLNTRKGDRVWFENPDKSAVQMIVPKGPQCLYDLAENSGVVTSHTYFVENPRMILCLNN